VAARHPSTGRSREAVRRFRRQKGERCFGASPITPQRVDGQERKRSVKEAARERRKAKMPKAVKKRHEKQTSTKRR